MMMTMTMSTTMTVTTTTMSMLAMVKTMKLMRIGELDEIKDNDSIQKIQRPPMTCFFRLHKPGKDHHHAATFTSVTATAKAIPVTTATSVTTTAAAYAITTASATTAAINAILVTNATSVTTTTPANVSMPKDVVFVVVVVVIVIVVVGGCGGRFLREILPPFLSLGTYLNWQSAKQITDLHTPPRRRR